MAVPFGDRARPVDVARLTTTYSGRGCSHPVCSSNVCDMARIDGVLMLKARKASLSDVVTTLPLSEDFFELP